MAVPTQPITNHPNDFKALGIWKTRDKINS